MAIPLKQSINLGSKFAFLLIAIAGILALQQTRLQSLTDPQANEIERLAEIEASQNDLQLQLLRNLPDLGFRNLVADWTFLNFLQYFGNHEYRQITGFGLSGDYFDVIINLDPYAYLPYQYLSSSVSLFAAEPERAVALQAKGLESLAPDFPPKSYFIWRHKGIDEILFLDDYEAATHSHEMAADWAAQSSFPLAEDDQHSLRRTAEFLASNPNRTDVQINAWVQVLQSAPDAKTQAVAIENLRALGIEVVQNEDGTLSLQSISSPEPAAE
jgi:hypothetical protein